MLTDTFGRPLSTARVTTLFLIVVVNIYNLLIIQLNNDTETRMLLGDDFEAKRKLIMFETIVTIFAITISAENSVSMIIFATKYWIFGINYVTLIFDLVLTFGTAVCLFKGSALDEFWKLKTDEKESVAPVTLHYLVCGLFVFNFALKLVASHLMSPFGKKIMNEESGVRLPNSDDIEQNISSEPPPSYNQCVIPSTPPPSYRDVQK